MAASQRPRLTNDVLKYSNARVSRATVRRAYRAFRAAAGLPDRCDNPRCHFHSNPLLWNGVALPLILDHENGNSYDNRPKNLRYLCPNCDSQLDTRGGLNRGRVADRSSGGFALRRPDGGHAYVLPCEPGQFTLIGSEVELHGPGERAHEETSEPG